MRYYSFQKYKKYPHLSSSDTRVWERFIASKSRIYRKVAYDVRVGEGRDCVCDIEGEFRKDWKDLTCKRVDVVGYGDGFVHVIEVKPVADARCYGQVMSYYELYKKTYKSNSKVVPVVVCSQVRREDVTLFVKGGVIVYVV